MCTIPKKHGYMPMCISTKTVMAMGLLTLFLSHPVAVADDKSSDSRQQIKPVDQTLSNNDTGITVEADRLEYSKEGNSTKNSTTQTLYLYGRVAISQQETRLEADQAIVYSTSDLKRHIEATGKPARFRHTIPASSSEPVKRIMGQADRIEYNAALLQTKLIGHAILIQNQDRIEAHNIFYDAKAKQYRAESPSGTKKRVRVFLSSPDKN